MSTTQSTPVTVTLDDDTFDGLLLAWRWVDHQTGSWTGLVRYKGPRGLQYEQWLPGSALARHSRSST